MHYAMLERDVSPRPDVERSVMPDEFRSASATSDTRRNLRDWLIFRDYMNGLEYVEQVFEYFRKKRISWGWQTGSEQRRSAKHRHYHSDHRNRKKSRYFNPYEDEALLA